MNKLFTCFMLICTPIFSCNQCLKYYVEEGIFNTEVIIDDMLESHSEENIPFFFFMLGRNNTLYEIRMQLDDECKASLPD